MMVRQFFPVGVLSAALAFSTSAFAQDAAPVVSNQATIGGLATPGCRLQTPVSPSADNAQVGGLAPGSADIAITRLVGDDSRSIGAAVELVLPATCNQAHTLNISSAKGALASDGPALTGGVFRSRLPYGVTVSWAGGERVFESSGDALAFAVGNAATGSVTLKIEIPAGGEPLAAGAYSDELILALGVAG